jgi:predicted phage baseplate assembly protein
MSCTPREPCGRTEPTLGRTVEDDDRSHRHYRIGDYHRFLRDLTARTEQEAVDGALLGSRWDVEADPAAARLASLWAYVAEGVAAYTELTANEAYLPTARDWTDLSRIGELVGYRVRPGSAASGWVRFDLDRGVSPTVPAGTRVQAPASPPARPKAQVFQVVEDTPLRADWGDLTATRVPAPAVPDGRTIRFLGEPALAAGDAVLLVREDATTQPAPTTGAWSAYWGWLLLLAFSFTPPGSTRPLAVAKVSEVSRELGTTVVTFDRPLDGLLDSTSASYAAYRIVHTATTARRLTGVVSIENTTAKSVGLQGLYGSGSAVGSSHVVLDQVFDDLSAGQTVAVVDWDAATPACQVTTITKVTTVDWEVAPGTPAPASRLELTDPVTFIGRPLTVHVLDERLVARHYRFPTSGSLARLRLYPRPAQVPSHVAVETDDGGTSSYEVVAVTASPDQESGKGAGLLVDVIGAGLAGSFGASARASANLARVHHGETKTAALGSGDITRPGQRFELPDAPLAFDGHSGQPRSSLTVRVEGRSWEEASTLYGAGAAERYRIDLDADGGATVVFGDGRHGARLPTGTDNVTATYRRGGGLAGEVASGAIDSLVGSIRGVQRVAGAGPTTGGAEHDDEHDLRRLVPTRSRAFGRAVSRDDLRDLTLGYPGVSHAATFRGPGPAGCAGTGVHVAFLRSGSTGPRAPVAAEVTAVRTYLDARRDTEIPLCVCPARVRTLAVRIGVVCDPRVPPAAVEAAVRAAVADEDGPLHPDRRALHQPLDRSDVLAVVQAVPDVVGVTELVLGATPIVGPEAEIGRVAAGRAELLVLAASPDVQVVTA